MIAMTHLFYFFSETKRIPIIPILVIFLSLIFRVFQDDGNGNSGNGLNYFWKISDSLMKIYVSYSGTSPRPSVAVE